MANTHQRASLLLQTGFIEESCTDKHPLQILEIPNSEILSSLMHLVSQKDLHCNLNWQCRKTFYDCENFHNNCLDINIKNIFSSPLTMFVGKFWSLPSCFTRVGYNLFHKHLIRLAMFARDKDLSLFQTFKNCVHENFCKIASMSILKTFFFTIDCM
jgi:hypothetical protein